MLNAIGAIVFMLAIALIGGCNESAIKANQQQLESQQAELDQLKQQISVLQSQPSSNSSQPLPKGACDDQVMREATRKGGERFAASDFGRALGYYQDALTACPANAQAQLNVARTYEAIGDRGQALEHYRDAATSGSDSDAVREAREALTRLGG
jgi:tetratricopeptide (TPR) repeat protein